jgi:hypothetical protein
MNKSKTLTAFLTALLFLFFLSPAALAMDKEFWNFFEAVECPGGEVIELEGAVRFQFQETGMGWTLQAFWTGDGWGVDSDAEYLIRGKWQEVVQGQRPFIYYWNDHFELVGKGAAPTYKFYSRIRFDEFDEDGNPIPEFISAEWPCETLAFAIWPVE